MTDTSYVFIGGVDVSHACLQVLCEIGRPPSLAISYDESRSALAGYADFGDLAEAHGFELRRVANVNDPDVVAAIARTEPALVYVIGWSQLVKRPILDCPAVGCVGIHPTRLPQGRGRAPIPWTILKDLESTASTMFFLTEGVDDGDVIGVIDIPVAPRETATTLYAKHRAAHVELVRRHTASLLSGRAPRAPQDHAAATYWDKRSPEDGRIDWTATSSDVDRLVRAVTRPFPGAFTEANGECWTIWAGQPLEGGGGDPGAVSVDGDCVTVACGRGRLRILEADGSSLLPDRFGG